MGGCETCPTVLPRQVERIHGYVPRAVYPRTSWPENNVLWSPNVYLLVGWPWGRSSKILRIPCSASKKRSHGKGLFHSSEHPPATRVPRWSSRRASTAIEARNHNTSALFFWNLPSFFNSGKTTVLGMIGYNKVKKNLFSAGGSRGFVDREGARYRGVASRGTEPGKGDTSKVENGPND